MSHHYIKYEDVSYEYPDGHRALDHVSFCVTHGEKVALLGRNGAGKSTALLLSNGLLMPSTGLVNVGDIPVVKKTLPLIRNTVGLVFQNPDDQLFMSTVEEDVAFGPLNMKLPEEEVERRVKTALEMVGASDLQHRVPSQLSGGQKRAVAIATVLAMEPSILVLDEPTSSLDWVARRRVIEILKEFNHTMIVATHDLGLVNEICHRSIVIDNGRVVADMPTEKLLEDVETLHLLGLTDSDLPFSYAG